MVLILWNHACESFELEGANINTYQRMTEISITQIEISLVNTEQRRLLFEDNNADINMYVK